MPASSLQRQAGRALALTGALILHGVIAAAGLLLMARAEHGTIEQIPVAIVIAAAEPVEATPASPEPPKPETAPDPKPDPKPDLAPEPEPVKELPPPVVAPPPPPEPPPPQPAEMAPPPAAEPMPEAVIVPPPSLPVEPPKPVPPPELPKPVDPPRQEKPGEAPKPTQKVEPVRKPEKPRPEKPRPIQPPRPAAPPQAQSVAPKAGILGVAGDPAAEATYNSTVRARLEANKRYPDAARALRAQGTVTVRFSISASGGISGIAIAASSGNAALDQAALDMVRAASPLPAPPGGKALSMSIPTNFRFR